VSLLLDAFERVIRHGRKGKTTSQVFFKPLTDEFFGETHYWGIFKRLDYNDFLRDILAWIDQDMEGDWLKGKQWH
jgi:hypothetical protein